MEPVVQGLLTIAQVICVNVVLSGDNALLIALAAQHLPTDRRCRAVQWSTALAVLLQIALAIVVSRLLDVPGVRLAGAVALVLIARKLLFGALAGERPQTLSNGSALLALVAANVALSVDNMLALGAISGGATWAMVAGIVISAFVLLQAGAIMTSLIGRFPQVLRLGAVVLGCTAAHLVCDEPLLQGLIEVAEADLAVPQSMERLPSGLADRRALAGVAPAQWFAGLGRECLAYGVVLGVCCMRSPRTMD